MLPLLLLLLLLLLRQLLLRQLPLLQHQLLLQLLQLRLQPLLALEVLDLLLLRRRGRPLALAGSRLQPAGRRLQRRRQSAQLGGDGRVQLDRRRPARVR